MIIENITTNIKNSKLTDNKNISYYINIECDITKLKKELEQLQTININEIDLNKMGLFIQELLLFKEFQEIFIKCDVIYNNHVLVFVKPEHKQLTRQIINRLEIIIAELNKRKKLELTL